MRAITIKQPWAQLIAEGFKDVENRTWSTRWRGPLLIHAGLQCDVLARIPAELDEERAEAARAAVQRGYDRRGMIVGVVQLVDVNEAGNHLSPWTMPEHKQWVLADPIMLDEPVLAPGRQGLWMPTERELQQVDRVLTRMKLAGGAR